MSWQITYYNRMLSTNINLYTLSNEKDRSLFTRTFEAKQGQKEQGRYVLLPEQSNHGLPCCTFCTVRRGLRGVLKLNGSFGDFPEKPYVQEMLRPVQQKGCERLPH